MRTHLDKLLALLTHKRTILDELVERQEAFKQFLVRPSWHRFFEYTQPQEALVQKLRQIQGAQDYLLTRLAAEYRVAHLPNLRTLCRFVDADWKRVIHGEIVEIRRSTERLRSLTRLSQALNQSHWQLIRRYMAEAHGRPDLGCTYNANGYTSSPALSDNRYSASV